MIWRKRADIDDKVVDEGSMAMPYNHIEQGDNIKIARVRGAVNLVITSLDGKIVYSAHHVADANDNVIVDSNALQAGLYIVAVSDARGNVLRGRLLVE